MTSPARTLNGSRTRQCKLLHRIAINAAKPANLAGKGTRGAQQLFRVARPQGRSLLEADRPRCRQPASGINAGDKGEASRGRKCSRLVRWCKRQISGFRVSKFGGFCRWLKIAKSVL